MLPALLRRTRRCGAATPRTCENALLPGVESVWGHMGSIQWEVTVLYTKRGSCVLATAGRFSLAMMLTELTTRRSHLRRRRPCLPAALRWEP